MNVFGALGSGYYSYGRKKHEFYNVARAEIGAVVAILLRDAGDQNKWEPEISFFERQLIPAFASLIKRMEKTGRKYEH